MLSLTLATACSDNPLGSFSRIRVLEMNGGSDTVLAMPDEPMVIEVRDNLGHPTPGIEVRFVAVPPASDSTSAARGMYVCPTTESRCAWYYDEHNYDVYTAAFTTTDSEGRARAKVQFGVVAGPSFIEIAVPGTDIVHRVPFTTRPGALARVVAAVEDTAVYAGSTYDLGAHAADRFGNARSEPVTVSSLTPAVVTTASGRLTANAVGRGSVLMVSGAIAETAHVSVPPRGRLVTFGWTPDRVSLRLLTLVNTDGTGRRVVLDTPGNNGNADPIWTPDGRQIVLAENPGFGTTLQLIDTLGTRVPFLPDFALSVHAAVASDNVYFVGTPRAGGLTGIYRASLEGTGGTFLFHGTQPAASPDGSRVAYALNDSVLVRDLATGAQLRVAVRASSPKWSPTGDLIAYVSSGGDLRVSVVRPDGSGARVIASGFHGYHTSWSRDGEWLATSRWEGGIELIRVANGERLPIVGTEDLFQPGWRP